MLKKMLLFLMFLFVVQFGYCQMELQSLISRIIAGTNITVSPIDGMGGDITINLDPAYATSIQTSLALKLSSGNVDLRGYSIYADNIVSGNVNRDYAITADRMYVQGFGNVACIGLYHQIETTYDNIISSQGAYYLRLPDSTSWNNMGDGQGYMTRQWDNADFTAYVDFVTSGVANGNVLLHIGISTSPANAGTYTIFPTTTTVGSNWGDVVRATFTVTGTGLADGGYFYTRIGRINAAGESTQDVYIVGIAPDIDID